MKKLFSFLALIALAMISFCTFASNTMFEPGHVSVDNDQDQDVMTISNETIALPVYNITSPAVHNDFTFSFDNSIVYGDYVNKPMVENGSSVQVVANGLDPPNSKFRRGFSLA